MPCKLWDSPCGTWSSSKPPRKSPGQAHHRNPAPCECLVSSTPENCKAEKQSGCRWHPYWTASVTSPQGERVSRQSCRDGAPDPAPTPLRQPSASCSLESRCQQPASRYGSCR